MRYSGSDLCCTFFIPYSGDRLLFTESGWGKAVLYPISGVRDPVRDPGTDFWKAGDVCSSYGLAAHPVCWCNVLRSGLYSADHWTKKYESNRSIFDLESGVLHLCSGRLGDSGTAVKCKRDCWLCDHVCSHYSCTAAAERESVNVNISVLNSCT